MPRILAAAGFDGSDWWTLPPHQFGRFLDTAATIATWWFFKVGQFLVDPTGNDQTGLQLCRTQDCRRDLRRGTDDRSATCGATTQLGVHNRLYLYTTAAQEIRQRKYTKDALASFNPHTGIQFIHFLRLLRIRFSKCQMSNVKCQIHPHRNELELRAV